MYKIGQNFTLRILCFTLSASLLLLPNVSLVASKASQGSSSTRTARPRWNRPEGSFPNLEDIKSESDVKREPAAPIPSTIRSKKNEGKPWDGRRVGEPFTEHQPDQVVVNRAGHGGQSHKKFLRRAHANRRFEPLPTLSEDQFIQNFFSLALLRSANSEETLYWNHLLRAGHSQGVVSLKLAAIELGRTLFESASYAARNRNAHDYVYDLYKTYLMRDPDAGGWAMWEGLVASHGREYVRRGFEESSELATLMGGIVPSGATSPTASSLISALVNPRNQPRNGMLTRDASWSVALLSLPGRNGLDLGLSLSYSSMVWTRSGPYFYFDEDNGFPSPGFRLGFPTVQRKTFDAQTAKNSYLLITPAGHRVDLRQAGPTVYEAADSSYLQLSETGATLLVRSTDGTQLTFAEANNEYRCTQIKDRNGNYITINYNASGRLTSVTDTLGRVITFNYDTNANLLSITQAWNGQPSHQWVSFGWSTRNMQYSFANDAVIGTRNGTAVPVITQVGLNDTSHFTFNYTNSLQVSEIRNYFGTLERNATTFTYQTVSGDVPRVSSSSVSARNWSGYNNVPAQVTTQYSVAADGACVMTAPDGTSYKEYYGTGWQQGLTTQSEVWSGGVKQKWTTTAWTQNDTSVSYQLNPRVTETNVYDAGNNRRRTTIHYENSQYAQYGLPSEVREYAADAGTVIRKTLTDYNLSQAYLNARIIGLISQVQLMNGSQYLTRLTYAYDDPARLAALPASPTQHDTSYNTSFTARGNVTSISRWDVTDVTNAAKKLTSHTNYYITGSPSLVTDPAGHQSSIGYADAFSDSVIRNTFAYPTTLTDADNFSSSRQYNFDFGAPTRTQSPAPAGQPQGAIQTLTYNNLGQLERVTTANNNAYQRFWYGAEFTASYATVNNVADEAYSVEVSDGLGQVIGTLRNHPGSTLGYSLVHRVYDQMGRVWLQSNPAEVNAAWVTTGGDDDAGIYYTQQTYDWQGRPLVTTNPDLTTKQADYSGCGCAGGEVVTLTDEGTINGGVLKKRQRKIYSDVLGRVVKSEILNWNGPGANGTGGTVYSATTTAYNARDQVTLVRQYAGAEGSSTFQDTSMTYDGYGRLSTRHVPEQNAGTNTVWSYNADDTVATVTDARGAITINGYNARHLLTSITYSAPPGISATAPVTFAYDGAGNRTSMTDGLGSVSYGYDQLSRMSSETRTFSGVGSYGITYQYNLAHQLSSITNPFSDTINYARDHGGRLTSVTGTTFGTSLPVSTYAANVQYRAWDAIKHVNYGDNKSLDATYNSRMLAATFTITGLISKSYNYHADGTLRFSSDLLDHRFDRSYSFDHVARLTNALSGAEARGEGATTNRPYKQTYGFDSFNHLTARTNEVWGASINSISDTYVNNRHVPQGTAWQYDADGRLLNGSNGINTYDAAGRTIGVEIPASNTSTAVFSLDGDGRQVKTEETVWNEGSQSDVTETKYYVRSSVLGGKVLSEIGTGQSRTFVYSGSEILAWQLRSFGSEFVNWEHKDPSGASVRIGGTQQELDPLGGDAGSSAQTQVSDEGPLMSHGSSYSAANPGVTYSRDGIHVPADDFMAFAGIDMQDSLTLMEFLARSSPPPLSPLDERRALLGPSLRSEGLPDLTGLPQNSFDVDGIRDGLREALSNPDCADFVDSLLRRVATKKNPLVTQYTESPSTKDGILAMFDAVRSQNGFTRNPPPDSAGYGNPKGLIAKGNAEIFNAADARDSAAQRAGDIKVILHELMHMAGQKKYYSDRAFAEIVRRAYPDLSKSIWPLDKQYKFRERAMEDSGHIGWGYYWNYGLTKKCF